MVYGTVQNALSQVLNDHYEDKFHDRSFGVMSERGCHDAIDRVLEIAEEGYIYVIDMDQERSLLRVKIIDQLLDSRRIRFIRHTDDCMVCKSERAAHGIPESKTKFIERKFFLQLNHDKTKINRLGILPVFLGFGSYQTPTAGKYPFTRRVETNSQRR